MSKQIELMKPQSLFLSVSLFFLFGTTSCSPVKGYSGPDLPESELSRVQVESDSSDRAYRQASTNDVSFGTSGILLMPGQQYFTLRVSAKDKPMNCRKFKEFNSIEHRSCEEKKRKEAEKNGPGLFGNTCDCYDFLKIKQRCDRFVYDYNCSLQMQTAKGMRYEIEVPGSSNPPSIIGVEYESRKTVGTGNCARAGSHLENEEETLGEGKSSANYNGFYSCF